MVYKYLNMYNENIYTVGSLVDALYRFIINLILFINAVLPHFYQKKKLNLRQYFM